MKTTFSRTLFALVALILVCILLFSVLFQLILRDYVRKQAFERLQTDSDALGNVAAIYYNENYLVDRDFYVALSILSSVTDSDAVICDADGKLLMCSENPLGCAHQGMVVNPDFREKILTDGSVTGNGMIRGLYTDSRLFVAAPIKNADGVVLGFSIVSSSESVALAAIKRLSDGFLLVAVLVVFAAAIFVIVYARKHSSPLRAMSDAAVAFGHGNLDARVTVPNSSPQEVKELALAFNNMAESLENAETRRKAFVANVSHELKTPMTTIGGYVDGILDGTIPPQQHTHYLSIVSEETKRLSRLVRSMLDISRLEAQSGVPEEMRTRFDIADCVGQVMITFEAHIVAKKLNVDARFPEYPLYVRACRDSITQVVYNLLDNAVKFCPQNGTLGVQIRQSEKKAYITISNDGPTIPPEELPLLFDRFHKLDKSRAQNRDGWGLGLYIVKAIIDSHGENISVSSQNDVTEFTFTLPVIN